MVRVIIESPYAPRVGSTVQDHIDYGRRCLHDCFSRGEAPIASHLLYTQPGVLDDTIPEERAAGIDAGLTWGRMAAKTVVYTDYGISVGMQYGIDSANHYFRPVEYRTIGRNDGQ